MVLRSSSSASQGFTATSLTAGLAWNGQGLIVARVDQGAAAAITAQVVTVIWLRFGGDARARALAPAVWYWFGPFHAVAGLRAGRLHDESDR